MEANAPSTLPLNGVAQQERRRRKRLLATEIAVVILIVINCISIILLLVLFGNKNDTSTSAEKTTDQLYNDLEGRVSTARLRQNLMELTRQIHISGTPENQRVINVLVEHFSTTAKLDSSWMETFDMPLSHPDENKENYVRLLTEDGNVKSESHWGPFQYNGYAVAGKENGTIIFANYGLESDFADLERAGIQCCANSIVFMRYGRLFRGQKTINAENRNALAVVLYPDPRDYMIIEPDSGIKIRPPNDKFNWYVQLQPNLVERGAVMPHKETMVRMLKPLGHPEPVSYDPKAIQGMPKIPTQPISFSHLKPRPNNATFTWGSLVDNVGVGPGYESPSPYSGYQVQVETNNVFRWHNISNVFAKFDGRLERDRVVIVGSHFDAWSYGATDPNGGTAIIMELAQLFHDWHVETGWRPRRTIMFANWDAEEFGLLGSEKWVLAHMNELQQAGISYLNLDMSIAGDFLFEVDAQSELFDVVYNSARAVRTKTGITLYDQWKSRSNSKEPKISPITPSSDQAPFAFTAGISSVYPKIGLNKNEFNYIYPTYHTLNDSFQGVEAFYDPQFERHATMARFALRMILELSESPVLPLSMKHVAEFMRNAYNTMVNTQNMNAIAEQNITFDTLQNNIEHFNNEAVTFQNQCQLHGQKWGPLQQRIANDAMLSALRSFIVASGHNKYANILAMISVLNPKSAGFPALNDALIAATTMHGSHLWTEARRQLILLEQRILQSAALLGKAITLTA